MGVYKFSVPLLELPILNVWVKKNIHTSKMYGFIYLDRKIVGYTI